MNQIFNNEIKKSDDNIKLAIETMNESNILKIEVYFINPKDVLPFIMDNIKIEAFKEDIQGCIKKYEEDNSDLKVSTLTIE